MKLTKEREGYNWKADDEGGIYFSHTGHLQEPPVEMSAHRIGHVCLVKGPTAPIELARLEYIGRAYFGEARPSGFTNTKWTGDHLTFSLYIYKPEIGEAQAVILRYDGSGSHLYLVDQLESAKTFRALCATLAPELLWDVLCALVHTYHQGVSDGRQAIGHLFLEGRLKKRKKGNRLSMEIVPPKATAQLSM